MTAITTAARLLRVAADELKNAHTLGGDWGNELEALDAYNEHMATATTLEHMARQCLAPAGNEEVAFTKWFQCQQGTPYQGMWEFARAAWMARAAAPALDAPAAPATSAQVQALHRARRALHAIGKTYDDSELLTRALEADEEIDRMLAAAPQTPAQEAPAAPAVPAGFALVPIEPTQQMLDAGRWSGAGSVSIQEEWARKEMWSRMLATITPPPAAYTDDLVALVENLAQALSAAAPDNDLAGHALNYLKRNGLQESPLRAAEAAPQAPAAAPVARAIFTNRKKPDVEWLVESVTRGMLLYAAPQAPAAPVESKTYSDGTTATGPGALPALSPQQQVLCTLLDTIEAMLGGANGPTIQIRAALLAAPAAPVLGRSVAEALKDLQEMWDDMAKSSSGPSHERTMRRFGDALSTIERTVAAPAAPAVDATAERDAAFEAVRQRLCRIPRWSFHIDSRGNIRRVDDASGNWIEFSAAHQLFDPVAVDAAITAQAKEGGAA